MSVEPESAHALTGAYVLDALDDDEEQAFEQHLAVCADCRDEVDSLRQAADRLPAVSATAPPAWLRDQVLSSIASVRPLPPQAPADPAPEAPDGAARVGTTSRPGATTGVTDATEPATPADELAVVRARRRRRGVSPGWRLAAAAASVVALVAVVWGANTQTAPPPREAVGVEQTTDADLLALLRAPDLEVVANEDPSGVHGTVFRSDAEARAAMVMQDLPVLTDDLVYQAWTLIGAEPASAGVFESLDGSATVMLEGDVVTADAMAISVEPSGGSTSPTGDIVLQVAMPEA